MLSIRARLFLFLLHHRHVVLRLARKETARDWANDILTVRQTAARSARMLGRVPKGMSVERVFIGEQSAEWILPEGGGDERTILYFRGGGYVLGTIEAHRAIAAKFVRRTGVRALLFEYRLAPEHPHPAALEDALAAYAWLLKQGVSADKIVCAGDSAGGGLCLAMLLALKDMVMALPAGAAVLSPWTDLACTGESLRTNAERCVSPEGSWLACRDHYAPGMDRTLPYISPLYGDLHGLPPLYITAGGYETLLSDTLRFAEKAEAAGVDVTLEVGERLCHCYPACAPIFPEATQTLKNCAAFIRERLGG